MRFNTDLKFKPCETCGGPPNTYGAPLPRSIFYHSDRIEVRCNNRSCGEVIIFHKKGGTYERKKIQQS